MITTAVSWFLRYDELSNLKCTDVSFEDNRVELFIPKSKTDQYRHGCEILLSQCHTSACPVIMLKRYMSLANLDVRSNSFLSKAMN